MPAKPHYAMHDGFRMPMGFPVEGFMSARTYQARPEDIFISTYPKCGTTWMQHLVWLILHRGMPLGPNDKMTHAIPHLEEVGSEFVRALPEPRVIKTHLPFSMTPYHPQARIIYVARNPFDCVVSFYHHTRGFVRHYDFGEGTFEDYFECFVTGEVDFGDYFENVSSWLAHRGERNFLLLTYEQMRSDPRSAVLAVGDFLGPEIGAAVNDEAVVELILEHSSFASMRRDQLRWTSKRPDNMPEFIRKGVVGDWVNTLSPVQTGRLLARMREAPAAETLVGLWPEIIESAEIYAASGAATS